jgi:hypothetical protein
VDLVVGQRAARRERIAAAYRAVDGSPRALDALLGEATELVAWERATAVRLDRPGCRRSILLIRLAGAVVCALTLVQIAVAAAGLTDLWRIGPAGLLLAGGLYDSLGAGRVGAGLRHLWRRGGAFALLVAALAAGLWGWPDGPAPAAVAGPLGALGALGYLAGLAGEHLTDRRDPAAAAGPGTSDTPRVPTPTATSDSGEAKA